MADENDHNHPVDRFYREKFRNEGLMPIPGAQEEIFQQLRTGKGKGRGSRVNPFSRLGLTTVILSASLVLNGVLGFMLFRSEHEKTKSGEPVKQDHSPEKSSKAPDTVYYEVEPAGKDDSSEQGAGAVEEKEERPAGSSQPVPSGQETDESPDKQENKTDTVSGKEEKTREQLDTTASAEKVKANPVRQNAKKKAGERDKIKQKEKKKDSSYGHSLNDFYKREMKKEKDSSNEIFIEE